MLKWFHVLMPREERFFDMFEAHAKTLVAGSHALRRLLEGGEGVPGACDDIMRHEHEADDIARDVMLAVRRTFITPFDRGDIKDLISLLDDAIDQMQKTAKSIQLFEVREFEPQMREMGDIIVKCADLAAALDDTDPMTATRYRERACRRGWSHSCLDRGNELLAEKRRADAMPWFERACRDRQTIDGCVAVASELDRACEAGATSECKALDAFLAKFPTNRRVAITYECCNTRPELLTTPGGTLLLFFDAVARKDLAAVRKFVHPKHPIKVRIGWHGEDGSSEDKFQFKAKDTSLTQLSEVSKPPASSLECDEVTADGPARCGAWGGGYGASFELLREQGRFYVTGLDEEGH